MNYIRPKTLVISICGLVLLTGCATKADIEKLQLEISALKATTEQANSDASDAKQTAATNRSDLTEMQALVKATNALVVQNEQKFEKMFQASMQK